MDQQEYLNNLLDMDITQEKAAGNSEGSRKDKGDLELGSLGETAQYNTVVHAPGLPASDKAEKANLQALNEMQNYQTQLESRNKDLCPIKELSASAMLKMSNK